jgi:hypothetical protein
MALSACVFLFSNIPGFLIRGARNTGLLGWLQRLGYLKSGAVKVIRSMVGRCRKLVAAVTIWERQIGGRGWWMVVEGRLPRTVAVLLA